MVGKFDAIEAFAAIPDQLFHYVAAVSGMEPGICEGCLLYRLDSYGVLVAWRDGQPLPLPRLESVLQVATQTAGLRNLTVLAAFQPANLPKDATVRRDRWWMLELPKPQIQPKLANMLRRARQELFVECACGISAFRLEHKNLVETFCLARKDSLDDAALYIYLNLHKYLASCGQAMLFSARDRVGQLQGFAIGDFSAFSTAFYMFAMRAHGACPGTADLLLAALLEEAEKRGMSQVNLGLGINPGIEFFKRKWGAKVLCDHVESSWRLPARNFFARLLGW